MPERTADIDKLWDDYTRTRSQEARDKLIVQYSPLVKYVAGRVGVGLPRNVEQGDLASFGVFGLIDAIEKGMYGPYEQNKSVSVNFLSTADTTLGNSGSASINAQGEFCGVLFDGNYESMATDWMFEEAVTRSIHTDVGFILWYLDAVAGADALLQELGHEPAIDTDSAADTQ